MYIKQKKPKREYSKGLLIQESALIWITSLLYIALAFFCIVQGYTGSLPWITASASLPWAAYGVSQVFYYKKSMLENTKGGIKYDTVMKELDNQLEKYLNMTYTNNTDFNEVIKELIKNNQVSTSSSNSTATTDLTVYTDSQNAEELDTDYGI